MDKDQNIPGNEPESARDTSEGFESDKDQVKDDYYSVDDPKKKTFNSTIGDGEMHNEGLMGSENTGGEDTFSEGSTSEQDNAEWHDSEG